VKCTIDASVFVSSARSDEPNYLTSRKFLRDARSMEVYCPTLALAECAAAIARQTSDPYLARELVSMIENFPGIKLISWDQEMLKRCPAAVATMTPEGWCGDR